MSFPRYPSYKDSGVEWIGQVPAHWETSRLKNLFALMSRMPEEEDGIVTAFRDGEVTLRNNRRVDGFTNAIQEHGYQRLLKGDLVIHAMDAFAGAIGVSDSDGKSSPVYSVCTPKSPQVHPPYYGRLLRHMAMMGYINALSKGIRERSTEFRWKEASNVIVAAPSLAEQTAIAAFLDRETGKIDALVAEQRRLMELLKEKRQAVISHAVTRGLNPAAPLKPSDVEWLGDVPAHWIVTRVRYIAEVLDHQRVPVEVAERADRQGDYPYYGASGIIDTIDGYLFDEPLVLVCEDGWNLILRTQPVARPVSGKIWVNNHAHILRPKEGDSELLAAAIELAPFEAFVTGMRQPKLTLEMLKDIPVALPPDVAEQTAIRDFMQCAADKFDTLTAEAQRAIDLLQERRTALISAAVTGQIDVRPLAEKKAA